MSSIESKSARRRRSFVSQVSGIFCAEGLAPDAADSFVRSSKYFKELTRSYTRTWSAGPLLVEALSPTCNEGCLLPVAEKDATLLLLCGYISAPPRGAAPNFDRHDAARSAEACLDLFLEQGAAGLACLQGSFVLVILDRNRRQLRLATDRFNSRPLYYEKRRDGTLVFSTLLRSVYDYATPRRDLDLSSLGQFLSFGAIFDEGVLSAEVLALPPATVLTVTSTASSMENYWRLVYSRKRHESLRNVSVRLADVLSRAVRRQTAGLDGVSLMTSGGLDSRLIIGLSSSQLSCLCLAEHQNREARIARQVARQRGFPFRFVARGADYYPRLAEAGSEIGNETSAWPHAHFADSELYMGRAGAGVATGYAFDMLMKTGGLPTNPRFLLGWRVNRNSLAPPKQCGLVEHFLERHPWSVWRGSSPLSALRRPFRDWAEEAVRADLERLRRLAIERSETTSGQFHYITMHMMAKSWGAFGNVLSVRAFDVDYTIAFDNELLDMHVAIPATYLVDGIAYKHALIRLLPEMSGIEDANTGLPPTASWLREHLHHRMTTYFTSSRAAVDEVPLPWATEGSWPNLGILLRNATPMRNRIEALLADGGELPDWLFDLGAVRSIYQRHLAGEDHSEFLSRLMTVSYRCTSTGFDRAA